MGAAIGVAGGAAIGTTGSAAVRIAGGIGGAAGKGVGAASSWVGVPGKVGAVAKGGVEAVGAACQGIDAADS